MGGTNRLVETEAPILATDPSTRHMDASHRTVVEPTRGWIALDLKELWKYRELLYFLTWRDIKVRYKQTVIGAAWAILQPFMTMVVFAVIFGRLMGIPSDGIPYPVFAYTALLPWTFFATAVIRSSASLVNDASMISKVYFPRLILPVAAVLAILVDFLISFAVLLGMMLYYGITPNPVVVILPMFLMLAIGTALGLGIWSAALNVKYRDVGHAIPFLVHFWFFVTPVVYPTSIIPERWQWLYGLNPMAGVVEGFRWILLGKDTAPSGLIFVSIIVVLALMTSGLFYFRRMEDQFADVI